MTDAPTDDLPRWLEDEARVAAAMAAGPGPGVIGREQVASMSGLAQLQGLLRGELPHAAIGRTLDFLLLEVGPGRAVFQGRPGPGHLNPLGTVHGGWVATLLDSALGCAVHTLMPAGRAYTTTDLDVKLVRAVTPRVARVRAVGEVLHCGRQLATATARLVGPDGTLYAHASTSCLVFDLPPARP
jgi:uncharacterized protein (TIGR00369 family)